MNVPNIPGFIGRPTRVSLSDIWAKPDDLPDALWPEDTLGEITNTPTEWVTLTEHDTSGGRWHAVDCALVPAAQTEAALGSWDWFDSHHGSVTVWADGTVEDGLAGMHGEVTVEFFAQAREVSGASTFVVDISHPFLWYWEAYPVPGGWRYTDRRGREHELLRISVDADGWKVEARALELRHYLAATERTVVVLIDTRRFANGTDFARIENKFANEWSNFIFHALEDHARGRGSVYSRTIGRYAITGVRSVRVPKHDEPEEHPDYPEFIYGIDESTGAVKAHTCDPEALGDYFHEDDRPHYLTPVYFKREVLQPYDSEPNRYRLTVQRLSCPNLWGVPLSFNSAGLIEVYLGDIGRYLPPEEWGHWRSYNVPPEGRMDEGRYRRDFLAEWAASKDVPGDLRRAREAAAEASVPVLGSPLWKPLDGDIAAQWESLLPPLTDDPAALDARLLTMTKALVDAIDPAVLKQHLGGSEPGEGSLSLLRRYVVSLGGDADLVAPLRRLQAFRSKGGVAHLAGSDKPKAEAELGIAGLSNVPAFEVVAVGVTECLRAVWELMIGVAGNSA